MWRTLTSPEFLRFSFNLILTFGHIMALSETLGMKDECGQHYMVTGGNPQDLF
jgi:hypothetical protein